MEILKFILDLLPEHFRDVIKNFSESSELTSLVHDFAPENLAPLIGIITEYFSSQKNSPKEDLRAEGLAPVSSFADKEIIYRLNEYLSR